MKDGERGAKEVRTTSNAEGVARKQNKSYGVRNAVVTYAVLSTLRACWLKQREG